MENNLEFLNTYKKEYHSIKIPAALDASISKGLVEGRRRKHLQYYKAIGIRSCASILIALTVFTGAINMMPSFADSIKDLPLLGQLVEILTFVDGKSSGGSPTDGTDISKMEGYSTTDGEDIIIQLGENAFNDDTAGSYTIQYSENPSVLTFDIGGARRITAKEDFEKIASLHLVEDVYTLMTLDDSLIRFNIVFKEPIDFQIEEYKSPASLKIHITPKNSLIADKDLSIFTVRSNSYEFNESFGHLEENLMRSNILKESEFENIRILKDSSGQFCFELGQFDSLAEAEIFLKNIENTSPMPLVIEERLVNDLPHEIN
jgi:hypothetical protein